MLQTMGDIARSLSAIQSKIQTCASGRNVRLVAVSKTKPVEDLMEAYNAGQRHFGENYVLELQQKSLEMPADIRWHFIGHLQTNKARKLLETRNLFVVETVDSEKVAKALNKQMEVNKTAKFNDTLQSTLNIFVQVKTSDEDSKSGVEPENCASLVQLIMEQLPNLKVCGLMTIGKLHGDPSEDFNCLKQTRSIVATALSIKEEELELSMGMSSDFEAAIEAGSTSVRVGSSIFGARAQKPAAAPSDATPSS